WRKKLKEREEGTTQRHFGAAAKAIEAQRATSAGHAEPQRPAKGDPASPFAMSFSDPEHETKKVEELYQKLVEVRTATGEKGGTPSFEDFGKFVRQKTRELKGKKRSAQIEYTVSVEDGRVKLKARVSG
ncbi:MAG: MXAN_5187 C-terminal domain-containing protein, partial [Candidatus Acidiferrales bacterium]